MSNYFTVEQEQQRMFTQLPKALLYEEQYKKMSNDAKVLYSFLMDKVSISLKNNWIDLTGRVFIRCSEIAMAEILNKSEKTVRKYKKELIDKGLLESANEPEDKTKWYVLKPNVSVENLEKYVDGFNSVVKVKRLQERMRVKLSKQKNGYGKKYRNIENTSVQDEKSLEPLETLGTVKSTVGLRSKLPYSNTDISNTDFSMYVCTDEPTQKRNSLFLSLYEKYVIPSEDMINILPSYEDKITLELYEKILLDTINKSKLGTVHNIEQYLIRTLDAQVVKGIKTLEEYLKDIEQFVQATYRKNNINKNYAKKSTRTTKLQDYNSKADTTIKDENGNYVRISELTPERYEYLLNMKIQEKNKIDTSNQENDLVAKDLQECYKLFHK